MNNLDSLVQTPSDRLSRLSGIPLDIILQHLDLASFTNLRLTSRQLSTSTIHCRFFRSAKTDLSVASIQSLTDRVSHPQLGPVLRELTVVATLYDTHPAEATVQTRKKWSGFDVEELRRDTENYRQRVEDLRERNVDCTDEEVQEAQQDLEWMQARLQQDADPGGSQVIRLLSSIFGLAVNLRVMNLDACIIGGRTKTCSPAEHHRWYRSDHQSSSWPSVWAAASETYHIVTLAISRSRIQLEKLNIFPDTPACSVQLTHVEPNWIVVDVDDFAYACKKITSFRLSFSTNTSVAMSPPAQGDPLVRHAFAASSDHRSHPERDLEYCADAAATLRFMHNLTSLDLHCYHPDNVLFTEYTRAFSFISQKIRLGCLKELSLRGLPLRPDDLILFLTNHPTITNLYLDGIHLVGGSWSPVFSCIETMPALESLHLSSLSTESIHIINLEPVERTFEADPEDTEKWVRCGDGHILHTRDMCREEIQQGLGFKPQPGPRNIWRDDLLSYFGRLQYEFGPSSSIWNWDPLNEDMLLV
ncbi:f-box domain-containing protein [Fusarium mundagurra]|uniref:F-box domain-containing protein n=1 Tax=Fusarium mundagurra TaxID=1567541 RepID=A0A8H5YGW9_9HYPO|nr:f-box domain-containing protein [Fusarium mundagurra]